ncbi:Lrp/AsnC family transcriptional regulator [Ferrovibrio sp.]|uniref:Lrp/AsnC family transcriptional regulator n=1 Tax=Ferrovibrio sp. TaxID=1917215 RepID=UPI002612A5C7|nr:Lrp/AsnC family transcriptional regulator [Ferrovibrio sp.]
MLDTIDRRIVSALARNARMSLKELAAAVGLSSPSAAERLKRLEERGVIRGFTIDVDPTALGYPLQAMVRIRPLPGKLQRVQELLAQIPEIVECDKVTGDDCFIARMVVRNIDALDTLLDRISDKAETNTAIVKAHTVPRRLPPLGPA